MSSSSDTSSDLWVPRKGRPTQQEAVQNVDKLASSLKKTSSNLRTVDQLIEKYQDLENDKLKYFNQHYKDERTEQPNHQPKRYYQDHFRSNEVFPPQYMSRRMDGFMSDYGNYSRPHYNFPDYGNHARDYRDNRDYQGSRSFDYGNAQVYQPRHNIIPEQGYKSTNVVDKLEETIKELQKEKNDWNIKHKEVIEIKQNLEKQKSEIEQMKTLENMTLAKKHESDSKYYGSLGVQRADNSEVIHLKHLLDASQKEVVSYRDQLNKIQSDVNRLEIASKTFRQESEDYKQRISTFENDKANYITKIQSLETSLKDITSQKLQVEKELNNLQFEYKSLSTDSSNEIKRLHDSKKRSKCKSRRHKNELERVVLENQDLMHQTDLLRQQVHAATNNPNHAIFFDKLKRELDDALFCKVTAEEQCRAKEIEISELKSILSCIKSELKDNRLIVERFEKELQVMNTKYNRELEEKCNLINNQQIKKINNNISPEISLLRKECSRLQNNENNLVFQISSLNQVKQDLESKLQLTLSELSETKQEFVTVKLKLEKELENSNSKLRRIENELKILKSRALSCTQEKEALIQQFQIDSNAEIEALKMELSNEQKKNSLLRKNVDERIFNLNQKLDSKTIVPSKFETKTFLPTNSLLKIDKNDIKRINDEFQRRLEEITHVREILQQITPIQDNMEDDHEKFKGYKNI